MRWAGKIIGGLIGFALLGPVGAIVGIIFGHIFDQLLLGPILEGVNYQTGHQSVIQEVFFRSTFTIMGYLAKADGRVTEQEINATRRVMAQMGLNEEMKQEAIRYFNIGKQPDFNVAHAVNELRQVCLFQPALLRAFLEIQIYISFAEGHISAEKRRALEGICQQLGVAGFNFNQYEQQQRAGQNYQRHQQQASHNPQQVLQDAYQILGVTPDTSNEEIKKAYRRLMSKNHPDKLMASGIPPEMVKIATQKTQQIKSAYETIKQARGM